MPNYKIGVEVEAETNDSAKQIGGVKGAINSLDDAFGGSIKNAGAFGITLGDLMSPMGLVTAGVTAIGGALVATGAHAMDLASQVESSTALMTTQLGLSEVGAANFEATMRSIYENNYGESFETIAADMVAVEQAFGRIGGTQGVGELEEVTQMAIAFGDAFGTDVGESVNAAVTLIENFGLTTTEAFDFLVAGQQRGLDSSGDFLDTIGEYSVQFSQAGADAGQFFSILEQGNAGGVLGTDKIADAFKEFNIRVMDGSKTTNSALAAVGIEYEKLSEQLADGSITQTEAMQLVINKINEIEDPISRNMAGVALFGTQWEDVTEQIITEIDIQQTALADLEGGVASLNEQYEKSGVEGEAAIRRWNNALVDVGDEFNALKELVLPGFALLIDVVVIPAINRFTDWLQEGVELAKDLGEFLQWLGLFGGGDDGEAGASSVAVSSAALPVATAALNGGGSNIVGGSQIYQQFYIERGDFETVREAAEIGIGASQRRRGSS